MDETTARDTYCMSGQNFTEFIDSNSSNQSLSLSIFFSGLQ